MALVFKGNKSSMIKIHECIEFPPNVHSPGLQSYRNYNGLPYTLPNLELLMVLFFVITESFHFVLKHFGVLKFTSQIITGIILSPSLLGNFNPVSVYMFNLQGQEIIGLLGEFGYALFIFLIGVKMDLRMISRTGQRALCTGIACVVGPLIVSLFLANKLSDSYHLSPVDASKIPHSTALHCMTPFPVVAVFLEEMKIMNSEMGRFSMSSALVSDMFSVFLQYVGTIVRLGSEKDVTKTLIGLASSITYILVVAGILRPAMFWVIRQTPENRPVNRSYVSILIILVLISGVLAHFYGQAFHYGPFLFGLAVPAGPPLGSAIEDKLSMFVFDVVLPIYVSICSIRTNFWEFQYFATDSFAKVTVVILVVAFLTKILFSLIVPLYCNMPFKDALVVALILSCKGIIQRAGYADLRDNETITETAFALSMISVLLTATLIPIAVKFLYDPSRKYAGYQKRNIMHLKPNAELKILSCIHRSASMSAVINLIDAACPSKENPIGVYVLHLIELVGRATPVFISHQMQTKSASNTSYSENVILYFNHFARENIGAVTLNIFTSISPPKFMHEDICTLAFDKLTSLIVLPFHRKWSMDGCVESEDNTIRALNCSVLDIAPCSVGILVDRGHLGRSTSLVSPETSFSVAIVFLGGNDDREALAFAKRMAKDSTIGLTLIRFVAINQEAGRDWDSALDANELKEFRYNHEGEGFVMYVEEAVKDGPQTALILRSMVEEYDLIIVGRRNKEVSPQTAGLSEWNEFPELGTIGDLLASPDMNCKGSILVVQQQTTVTR